MTNTPNRNHDAAEQLQSIQNPETAKDQGAKKAPLAVKIKEAARLMDISAASVRRLITRGELKAIRKLRHTLITRTSIDAFLGI
jgi:excisionase family DNA binding protein